MRRSDGAWVREHDGRVITDELDAGANVGPAGGTLDVDGRNAGDALGGTSSVADGIPG